jgi:vanillate O-demethylase ferredoxin subunit
MTSLISESIMSNQWITVVVTEKWEEARGVFCFNLASQLPQSLPAVEPGAHVDVEIKAGLVRQYSLCQPRGSSHYQIGVLKDAGSRGGSRELADNVVVGATLRISTPRNHFALAEPATHSILIAGGIGITPILAMAEKLHESAQSFELHYGARSRETAAFFQRLNETHSAYRTCFAFDDCAQKLDLGEILATPRPGHHVYVCGPSGLIDAVLRTTKEQGWPDGSVHREYFAAVVDDSLPNDEIEVTAARSGLTVMVPSGTSVAAALIEAGVDVPTFCEQGVCGSCLTNVLEGVPDHRDQYLSDRDKAQNDQMLLCCSRAKTPALVLDI